VLLSFALALVFGALIGFLLWKFILVGLVVLGGIAGFFAANLLYNLVLVTFMQDTWAYFGVVFLGAIIGATLAHYFRDHVVIFSTALIGAYGTVRGASLFIGGYPNEITMYQEIENGTYEYSTEFLGYLAAMAVLFLAGVVYQEKKKASYEYEHKWEGYHKVQ
jgi:hypothetical protein